MNKQSARVVTVEGTLVALGPIDRTNLPLYTKWMNNLETTRFLRMGVYSHENEEDWYESMARATDLVYFTIYEKATMSAIGGVNLMNIDHANRRAELGIMIGDPDARGKGYGTETVRLACDFGFNALGLNSIMLLTYEFNVAGQKAYEKVGFKEFGRRRQARWVAGRYWDDIYYDLLASEFESPVLRDVVLDGVQFENNNEADQQH